MSSKEELLREVHRELQEFIKEKFPEVAEKYFKEFARIQAEAYDLDLFEADIANERFFDELEFILGSEDIDDMVIAPLFEEMQKLITMKFRSKIVKLYRMYEEEW